MVRTTAAQGVALLTLCRPERANAYNQNLLLSLEEHLEAAWADDDVQVLVLTGQGRHFCAGADLGELAERTPLGALDLRSRRLFTRIARGPKPVLAAVRGAALGGGLELALACDFRIVAESCRLGLPEIGLGLVPAAGGLHRLAHLVGGARARELILLGRELEALEALRWGLATAVVPDEQLLDETLRIAQLLATRDPWAVRLARLALSSADELDDHRLHLEGPAQALLYQRRSSPSHPAEGDAL